MIVVIDIMIILTTMMIILTTMMIILTRMINTMMIESTTAVPITVVSRYRPEEYKVLSTFPRRDVSISKLLHC